MKSNTPPCCILVSGIPAAGKSTAAKLISEALEIPCFSKDLIKERLFDTVGFSSRAEKVKLNAGATAALYYAAEQLMKNGLPFVLENNFENGTADEIKALIKKYGYKAICLVLTGDYERIYARFSQRELSTERHRGHVVNDCYPEDDPDREIPKMTYGHYYDIVTKRGMDQFRVNGENIVVDTTEIESVDWNALTEKIKRLI